MKKTMITLAIAAGVSALCSFSAFAEWKQDETGWWYAKEDGSNSYAVGDTLIDGTYYWFNDSGYMQTGWRNKQGRWFYYDADGKQAIGWRSIDGKWYYFNGEGVMHTGWLDLDGNRYFLQNDGMVIGEFESNNCLYFADETGAIYRNKTIAKDLKYDDMGVLVYKSKNTGMEWEAVAGDQRLLEDVKRNLYAKYVEDKGFANRGDFETEARSQLANLTTEEEIEDFIDYVEEDYDIKNGKRSGHYYSKYTDYNLN